MMFIKYLKKIKIKLQVEKQNLKIFNVNFEQIQDDSEDKIFEIRQHLENKAKQISANSMMDIEHTNKFKHEITIQPIYKTLQKKHTNTKTL